MKKKFNPELLKEELSKFKLLSEYDFYQEKKELPEYKDLILGDIEEADDQDMPDDLEAAGSTDTAVKDVADDLGVDTPEGDVEGETGGDIPEPEDPNMSTELPLPEPSTEPVSDDVEVDVTALVNGSEEAKKAAEIASQNSQVLLQKLTSLEARVANMDKVSVKIDNLEKEIVKRNPTPVEKLEMRSLSSYPYTQKLTDYWADKKGPYDVMGNEDKKKEYVLTKDDVNADYSDASIKQSFKVDPKGYEEENI